MQISRCFPTALWIWSCSHHLSFAQAFSWANTRTRFTKTSMHYFLLSVLFLHCSPAIWICSSIWHIAVTFSTSNTVPLVFLEFLIMIHSWFCFLLGPLCSWWCFPSERFNPIFSKQYATDTEPTSQLAIRWRIEQVVCGIPYGSVCLPINVEAVDEGIPDVTLKYLQGHFVISENKQSTMITMYGSYIPGYRFLMNVGSVHAPDLVL